MELALEVEDLRKSYNGREILKGCTLTFDGRGVYVLMGPNGSGKSTFLRLCALLEEPDRGLISYVNGGERLEKNTALRRRITLVLPRAGIFNSSVFSNVAFGLKVRGVAKKEITNRVQQCLESFGLADKKRQNALTLSSGESQRLGIARAMVTEPEILFLDEPTASVDQENSEIIEEIILGMKKQGLPRVIMTTHDPRQAERLADFRLALRGGRVVPS